jgi:hypothetical protein
MQQLSFSLHWLLEQLTPRLHAHCACLMEGWLADGGRSKPKEQSGRRLLQKTPFIFTGQSPKYYYYVLAMIVVVRRKNELARELAQRSENSCNNILILSSASLLLVAPVLAAVGL